MALLQNILDLVALCSQKGIIDAVVCPGSRNAAISLYLEAHPKITTHSISDERSAGFIAMGMAQESNKTVLLVCTSGTAAINFYPAIAEAFFLKIPLLVLTADRPAEWINQQDGQTIFQENLFAKHVLASYSFHAQKEEPFYVNRIANEAINKSKKGPVHINIGIAEPFYPLATETIEFKEQKEINIIKHRSKLNKEDWNNALDSLMSKDKILILVGQQFNNKVGYWCSKISEELGIPVIADCISNAGPQALLYSESIINEELKPDLLITLGMSTISKKTKLFLRNNEIEEHWHIAENTEEIIDPFLSITSLFTCKPCHFLKGLYNDLDFLVSKNRLDPEELLAYQEMWITYVDNYKVKKNKFLNSSEWSDLLAVNSILEKLTFKSILHLGNSMSVRYANAVGVSSNVKVYCNRGTSGIDGSLSTALGQSLKTELPVFCLLGDVSFQYDKNALWNTLPKENFKVIILNNQGGNIFRMIEGPKSQAAYKKLFETQQVNTAVHLAQEFGYAYYKMESNDNISLESFINHAGPAILECFTLPQINEKVWSEARK